MVERAGDPSPTPQGLSGRSNTDRPEWTGRPWVRSWRWTSATTAVSRLMRNLRQKLWGANAIGAARKGDPRDERTRITPAHFTGYQKNGLHDVSALGEDRAVPVNPLPADQHVDRLRIRLAPRRAQDGPGRFRVTRLSCRT